MLPRKIQYATILTGENRRTRRKTCPSVTLSTTNPTRIDANPGQYGERPATNDLSHGTRGLLHTYLVRTIITNNNIKDLLEARQQDQFPPQAVIWTALLLWANAGVTRCSSTQRLIQNIYLIAIYAHLLTSFNTIQPNVHIIHTSETVPWA
jgi:hypothetical protein